MTLYIVVPIERARRPFVIRALVAAELAARFPEVSDFRFSKAYHDDWYRLHGRVEDGTFYLADVYVTEVQC